MKNVLFLFGFLFLLVMGCESGPSTNSDEEVVEVIGVANFASGIQNDRGAQLLDVRTPAEYDLGTIPGSIHINYFDENFREQLEAQLDKKKPVYVFCRSGNRSNKAAVIMREMGFKKVYDLDGGWLAWNGRPLN